jgi:ShK domain-like
VHVPALRKRGERMAQHLLGDGHNGDGHYGDGHDGDGHDGDGHNGDSHSRYSSVEATKDFAMQIATKSYRSCRGVVEMAETRRSYVGARALGAMGLISTCLMFATAIGCAPGGEPESTKGADDSTQEPDTQASAYSVLNTLSYSILREYDTAAKTQGANILYPVCVTAEFGITTAQRQSLLALEQKAINAWNDALKGQTGWRVQSIRLNLVGGATPTSCPPSSNGLRVYKLVVLANANRGSADFTNFTNNIGNSEWKTGDVRREMHEYGHQVGLGDTYTEAGYELPVNQPPSIMNLYYNVQGLTQDDIDAVRQIWTMIRTNSTNPCAPGYGPGQATLNKNGHRFCVKLNGGGGGQCSDSNSNCKSWASSGECTKNPGYMLTSCCASCAAH